MLLKVPFKMTQKVVSVKTTLVGYSIEEEIMSLQNWMKRDIIGSHCCARVIPNRVQVAVVGFEQKLMYCWWKYTNIFSSKQFVLHSVSGMKLIQCTKLYCSTLTLIFCRYFRKYGELSKWMNLCKPNPLVGQSAKHFLFQNEIRLQFLHEFDSFIGVIQRTVRQYTSAFEQAIELK
jgi:hypothetical protein